MIRNDHNHKLQADPWHHEAEPHNNYKTSGRQRKQSFNSVLLTAAQIYILFAM